MRECVCAWNEFMLTFLWFKIGWFCLFCPTNRSFVRSAFVNAAAWIQFMPLFTLNSSLNRNGALACMTNFTFFDNLVSCELWIEATSYMQTKIDGREDKSFSQIGMFRVQHPLGDVMNAQWNEISVFLVLNHGICVCINLNTIRNSKNSFRGVFVLSILLSNCLTLFALQGKRCGKQISVRYLGDNNEW